MNKKNLEHTSNQILSSTPKHYSVFGKEHINEGAINQMTIAMKLPITLGGALMPDAHQGYGLPIGGVLAVDNAVIPYGVGVDIGCRMALSIYDIGALRLERNKDLFKKAIIDTTIFGAGKGFTKRDRANHIVLEDPLFSEHRLLRGLKDKAWSQLGSSGGGNHFVEFGIIEFDTDDVELGISKGSYVALLSHSGSRGLGASIADYYTKMAKSLSDLPREARDLAYLSLDTEEGIEYWDAMHLAGRYASACHEIIHSKISENLGEQAIAKVENHHNFAWKENWDSKEVIVHRKGATPASKGVLGFIPGSMATPGFLVRGKGEKTSINSAAHGAGRLMSRRKAIKAFSKSELNKILADKGITLIGAGMDEVPMAYKSIKQVMAAQRALVDVVGVFFPKIVRMADDGSRED